METILLVIYIIVVSALIGVILIQRSEGGGLGIGGSGGNMGGLFTQRGTANMLTRLTAILATIFFCVCLALAFIASRSSQHETSIIDQINSEQSQQQQQQPPSAPLSQ